MADEAHIVYQLNEHVKQAVEPHMPYLICVLPGWVEEVRVGFCPSEPEKGCQAQMETNYRYRVCNLTIFPDFLNSESKDQRQTIVHEAAHTLNAPISEFVESTIRSLCGKDSKLERLLREHWQIANEAATCDITKALFAQANLRNSEETTLE